MAIKGRPVNLPRSTKYGSGYIFFYSPKNNREVHAESQLEHAAFISFEVDSDIREYTVHPEVGMDHEKISGSPIFDALVEYKSGRMELIEVKYESSITGDSEEAEKARAQIAKQKAFAAALGVEHRVITDKDLFEDPMQHSNNLFMFTRMKTMNMELVRQKSRYVVEALSDGEEHALESLIPCVADYEDILDIIVCLLYEKVIIVDTGEAPLSLKSRVRLSDVKGEFKCIR